MPETAVGYFPDVRVRFSPAESLQFGTEIEADPHSGTEQRRAQSVANGQRIWRGDTVFSDQPTRRVVTAFLKARRGALYPFYFFAPAPEYVLDGSMGSVSAAAAIILPYKRSFITDIRVAGVTKAFTSRSLAPRDGTYAALRFDGVDDAVGCGTSANLRPTGDFTIAAWVRRNFTTGFDSIVTNETASASGLSFFISDSDINLFTSQAGTRTGRAALYSFTANTWTHIAVSLSGTTATFYANGVSLGTGYIGSPSVTAPVAATIAFSIGSSAPLLGASFFRGLLQDVRLYHAALSGSEILNIYNGSATPSANLKGHFLLTEGTGTPTDSSGYANTCTLAGSPVWVAGEDEVLFSAGAQTGAVTATLTGRPRLIVRSLRDSIDQSFMPNVADVYASHRFEVLELV